MYCHYRNAVYGYVFHLLKTCSFVILKCVFYSCRINALINVLTH